MRKIGLKGGFTIIEVVVVFLLILGVTFLILPKSLNTTRQARLISKWTEKYSQLEYMFSVIRAQNDITMEKSLTKAQNNEDRKKIVLETIKPYLRITSEVQSPLYIQHYMNKELVQSPDKYYFSDFYNTESNDIVGLKWVNADCKDEDVCAVMSFDINGLEPPNTWGYDIFGINLLKDKIEPLGKNVESETLKNDCSKYGFGTYCSYYYLIGGEFDN